MSPTVDPGQPDDTDLRFRDLIRAEFGDELIDPLPPADADQDRRPHRGVSEFRARNGPPAGPQPLHAKTDPFNFEQAMADADPGPIPAWEQFRQPVAPRVGRPRGLVLAGLLVLLAALVTGVLTGAAVLPPTMGLYGGLLLIGTGIALLLASIPRPGHSGSGRSGDHPGQADSGEDGAVL